MNPKVDSFLDRAQQWQPEMTRLRTLLLDSELQEDFKWGQPCYTFNGANVVLIGPFKNHVILLFTKGALLKDPHSLLFQPTEQTQSARQLRMTSLQQVTELEPILQAYIHEAIAVEKAGLQVTLKKPSDYDIPAEFQTRLNQLLELKTAFQALTPGRQRHYLMHFAAPKQSKTRDSRIEKAIPQILAGKGLND